MSATVKVRTHRVADLLASLVDKSLVVYEPQPGGPGRYRLLETTRQYAREKLQESQQEDAIQRRHRSYFLELAEEAEPLWAGPEQASWLDRVEREHDNLRAALARYLEPHPPQEETPIEQPLRLTGALGQFWMVRGHLSEGREWLRRALAHPGALARTKSEAEAGGEVGSFSRAKALYTAGHLALCQNDCAAGRSLLEESLAIYRQRQDRPGMAIALQKLGEGIAWMDSRIAAQPYFEESLALQRELGDKHGAALSLSHLGRIAGSKGDHGTARALLEEGLQMAREAGESRRIAEALDHRVCYALDRGDAEAAQPLQAEALSIFRALEDTGEVILATIALAEIAQKRGDIPAAEAFAGEALHLIREAREAPSNARLSLARWNFDRGDFAAARSLLEESLILHRQSVNKACIADDLDLLVDVAIELGDLQTAMIAYEEDVAVHQELGVDFMEPTPGHVYLLNGDYAAARAWYEKCVAHRREAGSIRWIALALVEASLAPLLQEDYPAVIACATEAIRIFQRDEDKKGIINALDCFAIVAAKEERSERAARLFGAIEGLSATSGIHKWWYFDFQHRLVAEIRSTVDSSLGKETFAVARAEGRAITLEQAIAYALEEADVEKTAP